MSIAAGEIGKQAVENFSKAGGDTASRSAFDMPGERANFGTQDLNRGDVERPGSGFDGSWDQKQYQGIGDFEGHQNFKGSPNDTYKTGNDINRTIPENMTHEPVESENIKGGAYKDIPSREGYEKHHIPADSVSDISRGDGPCVQMEKEDHRQTASFGNSKEAREYRAKQGKLIQDSKFDEALIMDIDDIRSKFGSKYDDAIAQAQDYADQLKKREV